MMTFPNDHTKMEDGELDSSIKIVNEIFHDDELYENYQNQIRQNRKKRVCWVICLVFLLLLLFVILLSLGWMTKTRPEKSEGVLPSNTNVCYICGNGQHITRGDAIFSFPGQPSVTCSELEQAGVSGQIPMFDCPFVANLIPMCDCQPNQ